MTKKLYLVPSIIADQDTLDNLPEFDIIFHDDDEDDYWFKEALLHLDEESE